MDVNAFSACCKSSVPKYLDERELDTFSLMLFQSILLVIVLVFSSQSSPKATIAELLRSSKVVKQMGECVHSDAFWGKYWLFWHQGVDKHP